MSTNLESVHEKSLDQKSSTVRGKDRYKAGVMEYKKMGYWEPEYEPKDTDILALLQWQVNPPRQLGPWCGPIA
jgi:ribulose-bisphosphate carboxylase large chain